MRLAILSLALLALGIGVGDEVLVPTLTYIASANAIKYCQATPVFIDSCLKTWQVDPQGIVRKITPRTKAIMPVHLYGYPCDMDLIGQIATDHGLAVIEDCAEAFGSFYRGKPVGNFGDVATFSFYGNKTISCGEGGMVVTNHPKIDEKIRHLKGQGLAKGKEYVHCILKYNYRLTNMQAAIGVGQLEHADAILIAKRKLAHRYMNRLASRPLTFLREDKHLINSYWMCSFLTQDRQQRDRIRNHLRENGVETRPLFPPIHLMPYYSGSPGDFPIAESISAQWLNLPSWPGLTDKQIDTICTLIEETFQ